jgi:type II secretory pathway pseudopilin PulG
LVETVVAIGLVSFSILVTIGLLSIGGDTGKRAKDEAAAARLTENEFERLRALSSTAFSNYYPAYGTKYFDSNVSEVPNSTNAIYQLTISFSNGATGTADLVANAEVRYPANAAPSNQNVYRFTTLMNIPSP